MTFASSWRPRGASPVRKLRQLWTFLSLALFATLTAGTHSYNSGYRLGVIVAAVALSLMGLAATALWLESSARRDLITTARTELPNFEIGDGLVQKHLPDSFYGDAVRLRQRVSRDRELSQRESMSGIGGGKIIESYIHKYTDIMDPRYDYASYWVSRAIQEAYYLAAQAFGIDLETDPSSHLLHDVVTEQVAYCNDVLWGKDLVQRLNLADEVDLAERWTWAVARLASRSPWAVLSAIRDIEVSAT